MPAVFLRRGLARLSLSGLALGFAVLATLAGISSTAIDRAVNDLNSAAEVSSNWDHVLTYVTDEDEAMNDFLRAPDQREISPVAASIGSARQSLDWLAVHGRPDSRRQIVMIDGLYAGFTDNLRQIVAAAGKAETTELVTIADEAALSAASLRKQLTSQIELERVHLKLLLEQVQETHQRLRKAMYVVFGIDVVLLMVCARMLLSYQRRIETHAERSHHRSQHDPLTGLPNRTLLEERMKEMIADSDAKAEPFAVFMLDLNGFKGINDTLGHQHGDLLLVWVAERLAGVVRAGDVAVRLGGDEFAILAKVSDRDQILALADRVQTAVTEPVVLDCEPVRVGVSIGVALCPEHSADANELLRFADAAMYRAKRDKAGTVVHGDEPRVSTALTAALAERAISAGSGPDPGAPPGE